MENASISAELLAKMFLAGAANLDSKKEWINDLNVFPVPDGDTGTNMTLTIMSAAKEVSAITDPTMATLAKAIASGSLRGARGNSGVILSQLFRGFTKAIAEVNVIDAQVLCEALERAVETAYKAVMKPKEGTILTVARGMSEKALELVDSADDLIAFIDAIIEEGDRVLEYTPELLPVLKQAGVVDSGGQGLMVVLKGMQDVLHGKEVDYTIEVAPATSSGIVKISAETEEEIKFGYCTEYIIVLNNPLNDDQVMEYKAFLESIGDSIVVVADDEIVKTHVHTNDPGLAIQKALSHGSLSKIKIDNMREEHQERLIKDAAKVAAEQKAADAAKAAAEPAKEMGFVVVSIGEGLGHIFTELGADAMIEGGQTMNPSTEDVLEAIAKVNAKTVFVLPNNKNIILAANQAADLCEDKQIIVIPTKTIPQGITALINFMPEQTPQQNADRMNEEITIVKTGQVTYAVRDTMIDDKEIKEGDYMGIGDAGMLAVSEDMGTALLEMIDAMVDEDSAVVSIYYGAEATEEDAAAYAAAIEEKYPDLEIEVEAGGQPVYYYIVSVE